MNFIIRSSFGCRGEKKIDFSIFNFCTEHFNYSQPQIQIQFHASLEFFLKTVRNKNTKYPSCKNGKPLRNAKACHLQAGRRR